MEKNSGVSLSIPQRDFRSKAEKLTSVADILNKITRHLVAYLPIANAHTTDFIVKDQWNTLVPESIRSDLLKLSPSDLALLPSGRLHETCISHVSNNVDEEMATIDSLVVCGDKQSILKGNKCEWDADVRPSWQHESLREYTRSCRRNTLQHFGLVKSVSDVLCAEVQDDLVPIVEFMSVKKSHEVEIMTELCAHLCGQHQISHMIDLGSGKGYLGSHLALKHSLHVLGIDSTPTNTTGAANRSERLGRQWNGLLSRSKQVKDGQYVRARRARKGKSQVDQSEEGLVTRTTSDIAEAGCDSVKRGVFIPVTQFVDKTTDLQKLLHDHLHSSNVNPSDTSLDKPEQSTRKDVETNHTCSLTVPSLCDGEHCDSNVSTQDSRRPHIPFMIGGLHACGDLTSNTLRLFAGNPDARVLCGVGCCYHHLTEAFVKCPFGRDEGVSTDDVGFPLSDYLRRRGCQLGRNARMVAQQAPDRIADAGKPPSVSLYWRALLQVILRDLTGQTRDDWQVGRIAAKCADFTTYVRAALDKLGMQHELTDEDIHAYKNKYSEYEHRVQCFIQLKSALAPCIEALILLDRLCFLLEQDCVADADIIQLFDPLTSPRCYALVAWK